MGEHKKLGQTWVIDKVQNFAIREGCTKLNPEKVWSFAKGGGRGTVPQEGDIFVKF